MPNFLAATVKSFCQQHQASRVLVGVSGGPDSLALLHSLRAVENLAVSVAHINHGLRPEAIAEAEFVAALCQQWELPYYQADFDVGAIAAQYRLSPEEAARKVRYAAFADLMHRQNIALVLVGHNADDQAETVLAHLLRGSGPTGLGGMSPIAPLPFDPEFFANLYNYSLPQKPQLQVGRPLLDVHRITIEQYCAANKLEPRHDATNTDPTYFRNRLRHELIPLIEKSYQSGFAANLTRLAEITRDEQEWLDELTEQSWQQTARPSAHKVELDRVKLLAQPIALQRRLLRKAYQTLRGHLHDLEAGHIEDVLARLTIPSTWKGDWPDEVRVQLTAASVVLTDRPAAIPSADVPQLTTGEIALNVPGRTVIGNGWCLVSTLSPNRVVAGNDGWHAEVDYDLCGKLIVRTRRTGERFRPLGGPGQRKLQDVMLDRKIPVEQRERWPLIATDNGDIVWLPGYTIGEHFKVTESTTQILQIQLVREDSDGD